MRHILRIGLASLAFLVPASVFGQSAAPPVQVALYPAARATAGIEVQIAAPVSRTAPRQRRGMVESAAGRENGVHPKV